MLVRRPSAPSTLSSPALYGHGVASGAQSACNYRDFDPAFVSEACAPCSACSRRVTEAADALAEPAARAGHRDLFDLSTAMSVASLRRFAGDAPLLAQVAGAGLALYALLKIARALASAISCAAYALRPP